jgi:hypothetical protein
MNQAALARFLLAAAAFGPSLAANDNGQRVNRGTAWAVDAITLVVAQTST